METKTLFSRKDYMNKKCSHEEYYAQFITKGMQRDILHKYSKEELTTFFNADRHLNNIPLAWWDNLANWFKSHIAVTNKKLNGESTFSLSDGVCALKAAAIDIILN